MQAQDGSPPHPALRPPPGPVARLRREPLLAFLAIAAAVFALHVAVAPPAPPDPQVITVTGAEAGRLRAQFRATWTRDPTGDEFDNMIAALVEDEVLVREALRYGLDQGDQVVRSRLRQKAEVLLAGPAAPRDPTEAELQAQYDATPDAYLRPATLAFRQVFLGTPAPGAAEAALAALREGADPATLGVASQLPDAVPPSLALAVDGVFGTGFFAAVQGQSAGQWAGPVTSAFGTHLVLVTEAAPAVRLPLAEVRAQVEADWRRAEADRTRREALDAILARYTIDLGQITGRP